MALAWQFFIPIAGTAVQLPKCKIFGPVTIKALSTNTGNIAVGNDGEGDVTVDNGLLLAKGEEIKIRYIGDLSTLFIDTSHSGDGICIIIHRSGDVSYGMNFSNVENSDLIGVM